jgi:hypothetical protein
MYGRYTRSPAEVMTVTIKSLLGRNHLTETCVAVGWKITVESNNVGWLRQCSDWATGWTTGVHFPVRAMIRFLSLLHRFQIGSEAHPASFLVVPRGKMAGA